MMVSFKGEINGCEKIEDFGKKPDVAERMDFYKVSKKCPVAKVSSVCLSQLHVSGRINRFDYCLMEWRSRFCGDSWYQI
jgi:hypothetical protein